MFHVKHVKQALIYENVPRETYYKYITIITYMFPKCKKSDIIKL